MRTLRARVCRHLYAIVGLRHVLFASNNELAQKTADLYMKDQELHEKAEQKTGRFWSKVNRRSIFHLVPIRQIVEALRRNDGQVYQKLREWAKQDFEVVLFRSVSSLHAYIAL